MRNIFVVSTITLLFLSTMCLNLDAQTEAIPQSRLEILKLGIIHTNDTHGFIEPFAVDGTEGWGGIAHRAAAIDAIRFNGDYEWLTLDAGDIFGDTPLSDLHRGDLDLALMGELGYDAMCLGNCDFGYGYDRVRELVKLAKFPVLCANVATYDDIAPAVSPFVIIRRGPYRIGVIGLIRETFAEKMYYMLGDRVRSRPVVPVAKHLACYLRELGCDVVVALTHQGYDHDLELAAAVPELDLIVGGHSHTTLTAPERIGDVLVTQNGEWGRTLGVLKLEFVRDDPAMRFSLSEYGEEFLPLSPDAPADAGISESIENYRREVDAKLGEVIFESACDYPNDRIRVEENAFADLVADALMEATSSDCVLFTAGHFRCAIDKGSVTFGELYDALPANNTLMKVAVSGATLRAVLDWAGSQYGKTFPHVAGMRLRYVDGKLAEATVGGKPFDDRAVYNVLMTDYLACSTEGIPLRENPFGPGYTGLGQRTAFVEWASRRKTLDKKIDGRVVFEWVAVEPPTE